MKCLNLQPLKEEIIVRFGVANPEKLAKTFQANQSCKLYKACLNSNHHQITTATPTGIQTCDTPVTSLFTYPLDHHCHQV